jgi:type I restriction enzyme S subunit
MSSDWDSVTLGDVLTLQRGIDLPVQERKSGSIPVVASTGVVGFHCDAPVKGPGVVIGRSGSIGGGQYIESDFWPLNTTLWVKDFKGNSPRFCYYLLKSMDFSGMNAGSGVPTLNRNHLHPLPVLKPSIEEQNSIAETLGALDDRIALLRETNKTLEAIAQAIFKSWFIDFDPVRAKMEGRAPSGLDEETAALFPDGLVESELGLVPKGWKVGDLNDIGHFQNGYAFKSKDWTDQGFQVVKIGNVKPTFIDFHGCSYVSEATVNGLERYKLATGDLLVGMTGYVGEVGLVAKTSVPSYLNQRVGKISAKNGFKGLGFLFCVATMREFKTYAESQSHGSAQANVSGTDLMKFKTVIPSADVLSGFNSIVNCIIEKLLMNQEMVETLGSVRDELLPRLISGRLRVDTAAVEAL